MITDPDALSLPGSPARKCRRSRLALHPGLILGLSLLLLSACSPAVTLLPSGAATSLPVATVTPQQHALSILGVEFDPPLDYAQILSRGGVSLLVALENPGLSTESNVRVTAQLLDSTDRSKPQKLFDDAVTVKNLAPGELRVVRFPQVSELPRLERYRLQVQVEPVPGEQNTNDNERTYEIEIRSAD
jgi:hypothetical protein